MICFELAKPLHTDVLFGYDVQESLVMCVRAIAAEYQGERCAGRSQQEPQQEHDSDGGQVQAVCLDLVLDVLVDNGGQICEVVAVKLPR